MAVPRQDDPPGGFDGSKSSARRSEGANRSARSTGLERTANRPTATAGSGPPQRAAARSAAEPASSTLTCSPFLRQLTAAPAAIVAFTVVASALSACTGPAAQQSPSASIADAFDPKVAAQRNYDQSLADYQNCYAANASNPDACEKQRQMLEASTKLLAATLKR
jgi:hypothetical protein